MVEKKKNLSDFSIKRVHRLIEEEREYSLVRYFKKFLRDSLAEEHKIEIEEYVSKLIADENYPIKKSVLKKLETWSQA